MVSELYTKTLFFSTARGSRILKVCKMFWLRGNLTTVPACINLKNLLNQSFLMSFLLSKELHFLGQTSPVWPHVAAKVLRNIFIDTFLSDKTTRGSRILFESAKNARFATNFVEFPTILWSFLEVRPFVSKSVGYNNTFACILDHGNN